MPLLAVLTAVLGLTLAVDGTTVEGYGVGHGRGLSQYGAQSRAADGAGYDQILDFYYPGTEWGTADGDLRILISDDTSSDLVVQDRDGLVLRAGRSWRLDVPRATRWRVVPLDDARSRIDYRTGRWHRWRQVSGEVSLSARGPLRLLTPSGSTSYRGELRSVTPPPGSYEGDLDRDTVNVVPMESYLRGVVPLEIPAEWQPHAVRAQAVAARTYAAHQRAASTRHYDLCSTDFCQVYGGADAEHRLSDAAVRRTAGRVRTYEGEPAFTQFSASNGGWTAAGPFPYLQHRQDDHDPRNRWTRTIADADVEQVWAAGRALSSVEVVERDAEVGGRVVRLRLSWGDGSSTEVSGESFRLRLGLPSALFTIS